MQKPRILKTFLGGKVVRVTLPDFNMDISYINESCVVLA